MNLRELTIFIAEQMEDRLTECGIDINQIIQIKILDRKFPPDDSVVWMLRPQEHGFDNLAVYNMLRSWINSQIIVCYMENKDRDLAIEIMGNGKGMMAI